MISYANIEKRKTIHAATKDNLCLAEASRILDRYSDLGEKSDLEKLIKYCTVHYEAADTYFDEIVRAVNSKYPEMIETVTESIVPLVNYNSSDYKNFPEVYKALRSNEKIDNMLMNHRMINEKYDIEGFVTSNKLLESKDIAEITASTVNRFDTIPVRGKVQIALQEFFLLANKYGIKYDDKVITETIVNTIVDANPNSNDTIQQIDNTIRNNECIDTATAKPVCDHFGADTIRNYADELCNDTVNKFRHIDSIYYRIRNSCHGDIDQEFKDAMKYLADKMISVLRASAEDGTLSADDLRFLKDSVDKAISKQILLANKVQLFAPHVVQNFTYFLGLIRDFREELDSCINSVYSKSNVDTMNEAVEWGKIFKRENLIHALSVADKRLKSKFKEINNEVTDKVKKAKDWVFDRETKVEEAVLVDGTIDYTVESWFFNEESTYFVKEVAEDLCSNINKTDLYKTNYKMYYISLEGLVEFHLISNESTVVDENYNMDYVSESLGSYIESLMEYAYILEDLKIPDEEDMVSFLKDHPGYSSSIVDLAGYAGYDKDTMDNVIIRTSAYRNENQEEETKQSFDSYMNTPIGDFYTAMEAAHMLSDIVFSEDYEIEDLDDEDEYNDDFLDDLILDDDEEEYIEEKQMVKITKHPDPQKVPKAKPDTMKATAQQNFNTPKVDKGDTKVKVDDKDEEPKEKKPFIDLNSIKLTLMGFKKKIKDLDAKAQQAARNSDVSFNMFVNNVKKMLVSDRREAIIKGSVIPSFHRCILASIGLAGLAIINPIFSIIALIGGIAVSKNLTKKERALLMDDIAVEIEVIDKEIQNAEAKNQMKKLRALLKTKKELQRQYQRIRYNIRIGKDIIPSSTGTPGNN